MVLRVISYNVRRFRGSGGSSTITQIGNALQPYHPHIICLNEVDITFPSVTPSKNLLEELASLLGQGSNNEQPYVIHFFGHVRGRYGNAVLHTPDLQFISKEECHLPGGSYLQVKKGTKKFNGDIAAEDEFHHIKRGALRLHVQYENKPFTIIATHLDHIAEVERRTQLSFFDTDIIEPSLLLGDLNSLDRADYTDTEWNLLEEKAGANGWNPPASGALPDFCTQAGFTDLFPLVRGSLQNLSPQEKCTASVEDPAYRIDYCLANKPFLQQWVPTKAQVLNEITDSDHFPVYVELTAVE